MTSESVTVTLQPSGKRVKLEKDDCLMEALLVAGIALNTPCGGNGTCGKCMVRVVSGEVHPSTSSKAFLGQPRIDRGERLACQDVVITDCVVEIPKESLLVFDQQILVSDSAQPMTLETGLSKRYLIIAAPALSDPISDLDRIQRTLGPVTVRHSLLRTISRTLRTADWKVTALVSDGRLLDLEAGDTSAKLFGVAFDIGTTTIVGTLVDLLTGKECGVSPSTNPQISIGEDVIARIQYAREKNDGLIELQRIVIGTLNDIIVQLCNRHAIQPQDVYEVSIAGNTTMQQIALGLDPSALGEIPFPPVFEQHRTVSATEIGLGINLSGRIYAFGQIGGFVGGDTVAGMVACRIDTHKKPVLLVDIGTNGEIVLAANGKLLAASTAAGPAFEGARISQGMRAMSGAIEKVEIDTDVRISVIGNQKPTGLCGTALIDSVAELLRIGVIDMMGRIVSPAELPETFPPALRSRLIEDDGQFDFVLVHTADSGLAEPIVLRQKDIRELQLANGAIRAGISILISMAGITPDDLEAVLLAGAFGNYIRAANALRIGLFPAVPLEKIRFIGNAASHGAKLALLSMSERAYGEELRKKTVHVNLSLNQEFQNEYGMAMIFPEA